jgi:hypothetical protein
MNLSYNNKSPTMSAPAKDVQSNPKSSSFGSGLLVAASVAAGVALGAAAQYVLSRLLAPKKKYLGAVIGLKPEAYEEYKKYVCCCNCLLLFFRLYLFISL